MCMSSTSMYYNTAEIDLNWLIYNWIGYIQNLLTKVSLCYNIIFMILTTFKNIFFLYDSCCIWMQMWFKHLHVWTWRILSIPLQLSLALCFWYFFMTIGSVWADRCRTQECAVLLPVKQFVRERIIVYQREFLPNT